MSNRRSLNDLKRFNESYPCDQGTGDDQAVSKETNRVADCRRSRWLPSPSRTSQWASSCVGKNLDDKPLPTGATRQPDATTPPSPQGLSRADPETPACSQRRPKIGPSI